MKKNFIKTTDKDTADKLLAEGFNLVSHIAGVWTFQNVVPHNFNFANLDQKKIAYTNILSV